MRLSVVFSYSDSHAFIFPLKNEMLTFELFPGFIVNVSPVLRSIAWSSDSGEKRTFSLMLLLPSVIIVSRSVRLFTTTCSPGTTLGDEYMRLSPKTRSHAVPSALSAKDIV